MNEHLRIGQFITHYPYDGDAENYFCGGTGYVARTLSEALSRLGHDVTVFTTSKDREPETTEHSNLRIVRYPKWARIAQTNISGSLAWKPRKRDIDVAHAHAGNPPATIGAYLASKAQDIPFVVTYHGDFISSYGSPLRRATSLAYTSWVKRKMLPHADVITCPSGKFIDDSSMLPRFEDKVIELPNGLAFDEIPLGLNKKECREELGYRPEDIIIVYVGSLVPYKGPDVMVRAFAEATEAEPRLKLMVLGSGPLKDQLEDLAVEEGCESSTSFMGFVPDETKWKALAAADAFCLPSTMKTENFPIAMLEAQAFRLPLLASDLPTFGAMIDEGQNGMMTRRNDPSSLADAMLEIATDEDYRRSLSTGAWENVQEYRIDRIAKRTVQLYREVLG